MSYTCISLAVCTPLTEWLPKVVGEGWKPLPLYSPVHYVIYAQRATVCVYLHVHVPPRECCNV